MPTIKEEYIDTGKIRYVYRDFPLDRMALFAAMVARCSGRDRFFGFIDAFYSSQGHWTRSSDPLASLRTISLLGGMSEDEFNSCLGNQKVADEILTARLKATRQFGVSGTPTLFINGYRYGSSLSVDDYRAILDALPAKP